MSEKPDWTKPVAYIAGMSGRDTRFLHQTSAARAQAAYEAHIRALIAKP